MRRVLQIEGWGMRVGGGTAKGRSLSLVPGEGTRPIMDRVKTALFDVLRPRLDGIRMLDLFAGTGSIGIEALSQGVGSCVFTDAAAKAVATVRKNLELTGLADRAEVHHADALGFLRRAAGPFDLIYVAPPQYQEIWIAAIRLIDRRFELLSPPSEPDEEVPGGLVIAQIDPKEYQALELGHLRESRQKRYGNTLLVFYEVSHAIST